MAFDVNTTTDEVVAGMDLTGSTAVITGATGGLGLETARALASVGASVVVGGRDPAKGEAALASLAEAVPGAHARSWSVDLADLASVRTATDELRQELDGIDVLVNNAGVMAPPLGRTADGFELQFGTNHLGHFLLTSRLLPLLRAAAPSRVVNLSSQGHLRGDVDLGDPNYERGRTYDKWEAYGQSKTANILFTRSFERRFAGEAIHAYAVHPGVVVTDLARHMDESDFEQMGQTLRERPPGQPSSDLKHVDTGAATQVWAATGSELDDHGGAYLADCALCDAIAAYALDDEAAERLWTLSEDLVGEPFGAV